MFRIILIVCALFLVAGCKNEVTPKRPYTVALLGTLNNPLDPIKTNETNTRTLLNQVCGRLIVIDENLAIRPVLAESWAISDNNRVYDFTISKNYKFSDGIPVSAYDAKFSIERLKASLSASSLRNISEVSVPQGDRLRIRLKNPNVRFLYLLAHPRFCIMSQNKPFIDLGNVGVPNSFGDFAFEKWDGGNQTLSLRSRADGQAILVKYLEQHAALTSFNKGEIDDLSFYLLNDDEIGSLTGNKKVISTKYYWTWIFEINAKSEIGKDIESRRVLLHNFDQLKFITDWGVEVEPGQSVIPKGVFGNQIGEALTSKSLNKDLCQKPFSVGIIKGVPNEVKLETAIRSSFKAAVGCAPKVNWYSMSTFTEEVAKAKDTLYFSAISNRMVDPIEYYRTFIGSHSENLLGCSSKEMDKIFAQLDQKPLHSRSKEDYAKLHRAFLKAACGLPVGYPVFKFVYSSRVTSPVNNPIGMDLNFWATNSKIEVAR